MLGRQGVDVKKMLDVVAQTPVWSPASGRIASSMLSWNFAPQFPIELIEKDFSYTVKMAAGEETAPVINSVRKSFAELSGPGWGN